MGEDVVTLTKRQVAERLQVSPRTVERLVKRRLLRRIKNGKGFVRFTLAELRRYLERQTTERR